MDFVLELMHREEKQQAVEGMFHLIQVHLMAK